MRLFAAALLSFVLFAGSVGAATPPPSGGSNGASTPHNFGRIFCLKSVPCSDTDYTTDAYVSNANACITQFFGYTNPEGFFKSVGLDSNGCLTPRPNSLPKGMGAPLEQSCCITKMPNNSCVFRCELNTTQQ